MDGHAQGLDHGNPDALRAQKGNAVDPYGEALQQHHRDEPPRLVLHDDTAHARCRRARFLSQGEEPELDVRIPFEMVGMAVMPIMLLGPPAVANTR